MEIIMKLIHDPLFHQQRYENPRSYQKLTLEQLCHDDHPTQAAVLRFGLDIFWVRFQEKVPCKSNDIKKNIENQKPSNNFRF